MNLLKPLEKHWHRYLFLALLVVAIVLTAWLSVSIHELYRQGVRPGDGFRREYIRQTPTAVDIQGWMTFSYINHIFVLPADYLSTSLSITDARYPNLTVNQYAKTKNLDVTSFLQQVQDSVSRHLQGLSQ